jgi:hypothetical protein
MMRRALRGAALVLLLVLLLPEVAFSEEAVSTEGEKVAANADREKEAAALAAASKQYILLRRDQFEVENSIFYSHYSANQIYLQSFAILDPVFLTLGQFGIQSAKRDIFIYNLAGRYGILENLQLDVNLPYVYRHDLITTTGSGANGVPDTTLDRNSMGDISAGLSYQPISETDSRPGVILTMAYKSATGKSPFKIDPATDVPTGTGYQSIKGGVNLIKSVDPIVVFGGMAYAYNMPLGGLNQTVTSVTGATGTLRSVRPGDTVTLNIGLAYALSYKFALNFQFQQDYTFSSVANGRRVPNTVLNSALLKIGAGWSLSPNMALNISVAAGLTTDSPDFILEIRLPLILF